MTQALGSGDSQWTLVPLLLAAAFGAGIGALVRDALVHSCRARLARADLGIAAAQVVACLVAGLCVNLRELFAALLVAGFAGGLSTWSALAVEVVALVRARAWGRLALHLPGVLALSFLALHIGRAVAGGER